MEEAIQRIRFHYVNQVFYFPHRNGIKKFLLRKLEESGRKVEAINYVFCGDEYLLEMNKAYLNHDTLTDIITFELSPKEQDLIADVYISVNRVKENAMQFKTTFQKELHRVIFHGTLHLLGYKDKSARDEAVMRRMEEEFLTEYFVSRDTVSKRNM